MYTRYIYDAAVCRLGTTWSLLCISYIWSINISVYLMSLCHSEGRPPAAEHSVTGHGDYLFLFKSLFFSFNQLKTNATAIAINRSISARKVFFCFVFFPCVLSCVLAAAEDPYLFRLRGGYDFYGVTSFLLLCLCEIINDLRTHSPARIYVCLMRHKIQPKYRT